MYECFSREFNSTKNISLMHEIIDLSQFSFYVLRNREFALSWNWAKDIKQSKYWKYWKALTLDVKKKF